MKANTFAFELTMARKKKKLTQEEASVLIGVADATSISRWENGRELPSMKLIERIVDFYNDPFLGYMYLQQCTKIGALVLPLIERRDLGNSVLLLQKEHTDINKIKDIMIDIACDGKIDKHEESQWEISLREIGELASACMGIKLMEQKRPSQGGNLERAIV